VNCTISDNPNRLVNPRQVPRGAILVDPSGSLWVALNEISVIGCGDDEPRLITELGHDEPWFLVSAPNVEQGLPAHNLLEEAPAPGHVVTGLDATGWPVMWEETNHCYGRNTWEWFKAGSADPVSAEAVRYPIRCWNLD